MDNPYIQRVSFEDIQEFKNLDLFNLDPGQTNDRPVLLAYDPISQSFSYAYVDDGVSTENKNLTIYYGYGEAIATFIDSGDLAFRPSILGFLDGDGIISSTTVGSVTQFDFYQVKIDTGVDLYEFQESISAKNAYTVISTTEPTTVIEGGTWFNPLDGKMYVGNSGIWSVVIGKAGADGADGAPGVDGDTGAPGVDGYDYKTSTVFTRTSTLFTDKTVVVTGGRFSNPYPSETKVDGVPVVVQWHDGIPSGEEKVWQTTFSFNDSVPDEDVDTNVWTTPAGITDTSTTDYQYSTVVSAPGTPDTHPGNWDEAITDPTAVIWLAQRTIKNGLFGSWMVNRIKGETGAQGNGLDIKGRDIPCNIIQKAGVADYDIWVASIYTSVADMLACSGFTMDVDADANDAFLKVPDGTGEGGSNWDNIGGVVGTDGASFLYSIVYKRAVGNPGAPTGLGSFAQPVPTGWSDGIPSLVVPVPTGEQLWMTSRHFSDDPSSNNALADWIVPSVAADSNTQDFEYAYKQPGDGVPALPNISPGLWSDIPGETEYYWMAKANKINGVTDQTSWKINRIRGEQGVGGSDAISKFMASAYMRTEVDISSTGVTGGTYLSPIPTSQAAGQNWNDGIPDGPGAIWLTQVQMVQTDTGSPTKVWPNPLKIIDSSSIEYMFSETNSGLPVEGNNGLNGWWDDADQVPGTPNYMAIGSIVNGHWPTSWDIVQITGEQGQPGTGAYSYVPSTMFCRCESNSMASKLIVGKYLTQVNGTFTLAGPDPTTTVDGLPYTFTDGIPELSETFPNNGKRVWMIQGVLNDNDNLGVGNEFEWGNPVVLADNGSIDYQYHAGVSSTVPGSQPGPPVNDGTSNPDSAGWYDTPDLVPTGAFWLAQKNWAEGPAAQWAVYQIRGEDGADGTAAGFIWSEHILFENDNEESGPTGDGAEVGTCAIAREPSSDPLYLWFSGTVTGDYVAEDSEGTVRFNGLGGWWSDRYSSFKIGTDGRILDKYTCPSDIANTPTGLAVTTDAGSSPDRLVVTWNQALGDIYSTAGIASYKVEYRARSEDGSQIGTWRNAGNGYPDTLSVDFAPDPLLYGLVVSTVNIYGTISPRSTEVIKYLTREISLHIDTKTFTTLDLLNKSFTANYKNSTPLANEYLSVNANTVSVSNQSKFFTDQQGILKFNGGGTWYAGYTNGLAGTAYKIDNQGVVIEIGATKYDFIDPLPPYRVDGTTITVVGGNVDVKSFRLNWQTANSRNDGYEIWQKDYWETEFSLFANVVGNDGVYYIDVPQSPSGEPISWKIRAYNSVLQYSIFDAVVTGYRD